MSGDEAISDRKLDDIISKMDVLLQPKTEMLTKLSTLELTQATLVKDVNELKDSFKDTDLRILELNSDLALRAKQTAVDALAKKMDDLGNRSKRNNIVIWGVKEESEKSFNSMIEFLETELFKNHMGLDDGIEIMRAHRTNIKKNAGSENASPKPRPIHVYLLRYTDKEKILKMAPSKLKNNYYKDLPIFISDDVSKSVREDRTTLRKNYLADIKAKPNVIFAFIPWSVPAQILYKEEGADKLKSFTLSKT